MASFNIYVADGSETTFAVTFPVTVSSEIEVSVGGVVYTSGWTYNSAALSVVFDNPPTANSYIIIRRITSTDLRYKFGQDAAFTGRNIDADFEQLLYSAEEAVDWSAYLYNRALRVPTSDGTIVELPNKEQRMYKFLSFDGNGDPVALAPADGSTEELAVELSETNLNLYEVQERLALESGYTLAGTFESGCSLTDASKACLYRATGHVFAWQGAFPKSVPANSTPESSGGVGPGAWLDVTDATLRAALAASTQGDALVGVQRNYLNATTRTLHDELAKATRMSLEDFRTPTSTDDDLFEAAIASINVDSTWNRGFGKTPSVLDLRGQTYTISAPHEFVYGISIENGQIICNDGGRIIMGQLGSTATLTHAFRGLAMNFAGTADTTTAMLEIRRCFNVSFHGYISGISTGRFRSRYCLYMGSDRGWGIGMGMGSYLTGAKCPLRIGRVGDHTGLFIGQGCTIDHGSVCNVMLCNPAGFAILGCNVEHSDDGAPSIVITSETNGSSNVAHAGVIEGVYCYNSGNGTTGTNYAPAAIMIGQDVPGTMDWDVPGSLITSGNQAHSIRVSNNYIVSPKQMRAVSAVALFGIVIEDNKYSMKSGETIGFTFDGLCSHSVCDRNRNQGSGLTNQFEYGASTGLIASNRNGTFIPALTDTGGVGSYSYSSRGGAYSTQGSTAHVSGWMQLSAVNVAGTGTIRIQLPLSIRAAQRVGGAMLALNLSGLGTDNATVGFGVLDGANEIRLYVQNSTIGLPASAITNNTLIQFQLTMPITNGKAM